MTSSRSLTLGVLNGMGSGALWGTVFIVPLLLHDFTSLQMTAGRYIVYGLLSLALLLPRWNILKNVLGKAEWIALIRLSILGNVLYYILLSTAITTVGGPVTTLIIGFLPIAVLVMGIRAGSSICITQIAAPMSLSVIGILLIVSRSFTAHAAATPAHSVAFSTQVIGLLCAAGALASWTLYAVENTRWLLKTSTVSDHDWSLLTGVVTGALALVLVIPAFVFHAAPHAWLDWARFWGVCSATALLASVVANGLWNRASRLLPLTLSGQMIIFETLFALLYSFVWAHRWPSLVEFCAIICLITGVLWCTAAHRTPHNTSE